MSKRIAVALAWTLFILFVCWLPAQYVQADLKPGGFSLGKLQADKLVHVGIFAVLGYCLARVDWLRRRPLWILLVGATVALISEVGQGGLPTGRTADVIDFLADCLGVVLGFWIHRKLSRAAAARPLGERPDRDRARDRDPDPSADFDEDEVELSVRG